MKPFRFPLESLRVLRKQREHTAQQRYAAALNARDGAAQRLQQAVAELARGWDQLTRELAGGVPAGTMMNLRTCCRVLEIRWHESQAALEEAHRAAESAFQEMVAAAREREALDHFYDKSRRVHDREAQREEQKNFDELAVQMSGAPGPLQFAGHKN
jgi:flagellar export protein FliJ